MNVILINGSSSSGKSTIIKQFQDMFDIPYINLGIDKYLAMMPDRFIGFDKDVYLFTPINNENILQIDAGKYARAFDESRILSAKIFADKGNHLIADDIILYKWMLDCYVEALRDHNVLFVGLTCPVEILQEREATRKLRRTGLTASHEKVVHTFSKYDLIIDTTEHSPRECAQKIRKALEQKRFDVFKKLCKTA